MGRLEYEEQTSMVDPQREEVVNALFRRDSSVGADDSERDAEADEESCTPCPAAASGARKGSSQSLESRKRIRDETQKNSAVEGRAETPKTPVGAVELHRTSTVSPKVKPTVLQRQAPLGPEAPRIGAVAVIPAGVSDDDEEVYIEDDSEREEHEDDVSIESKSVMDGSDRNDAVHVLPEATAIPADLVEREAEAERKLYMLQKEMAHKKREMAAVKHKLAQMEQMERELNELKSALEGKVSFAELVNGSSSDKRRSSDKSTKAKQRSGAVPTKPATAVKRLDPAQAKAAAAAMAPEERKKMKEKGMDVLDFMVYQSLVAGKQKENKEKEEGAKPVEPRKNRFPGKKAFSFRTNKERASSGEWTDTTVLMDDPTGLGTTFDPTSFIEDIDPLDSGFISTGSIFDPISHSARSLCETKSHDDLTQARDIAERPGPMHEVRTTRRRFKNPVKKLYLKALNYSR